MPFSVNKQTACGYWTMEATEENPTWHVDTPECEGPIALSERHAIVCCEALNVYEQTGLTPAQLQARVAELDEQLMEMQAERNSAEMDDEQAEWERNHDA